MVERRKGKKTSGDWTMKRLAPSQTLLGNLTRLSPQITTTSSSRQGVLAPKLRSVLESSFGSPLADSRGSLNIVACKHEREYECESGAKTISQPF